MLKILPGGGGNTEPSLVLDCPLQYVTGLVPIPLGETKGMAVNEQYMLLVLRWSALLGFVGGMLLPWQALVEAYRKGILLAA